MPPPAAGTPGAPGATDIQPVTIEEEMRRSYLDYAMSVIVSRALPDVRDGLKPVHRRILFSMKEQNFIWNRATVKSARTTGDVMAKYHPHGDQAIYDAMARMAQDFSMRVPLIDGQGNFGSMDGDPPAAQRYTEARLAKVAEALLADLDKETVDFRPNYDEKEQEPTVLPAGFPNLLVNGAGGIAVGMATNIPTHNLGEVIDALLAMIADPDVSDERLMEMIPGPDFPTGGVILGRTGIRDAYRTGRGSIVLRGRHTIEELRKDRQAIVFTEVPFQVNKSKMLERIGELVNDKVIEGVAEVRDESSREGVRVVIELKRDALPEIVLNQLFRHSQLQTSFGVNMLAIHRGQPVQMGLRDILTAFLEFREEVINRRTRFLLRRARERAHILVGLSVAVANIDDVVALIRSSPDPTEARERLLAREWPADSVLPLVALVDEGAGEEVTGIYRLSDAQARAILDLRLQRLTGLERDKIVEELEGIAVEIKALIQILESRPRRLEVMADEMRAIRDEFADPRRTSIEMAEFEHDIEDLIPPAEMVVTVSDAGYIKRVPLDAYRSQRRGGKGRSGMATRDEDFVRTLFVANTHAPVLFFTTAGRAFQLKVWRLPEGAPSARGKPMINLLPLAQDERIATVMPLPLDQDALADLTILFATSLGEVRRNLVSDFLNIKANGKIAMKLEDEDGKSLGSLIGVALCHAEEEDVLLATRMGKVIRFPVSDVRVFTGRTSTGVRGIRLADGDELISLSVLKRVDVSIEERDAYLRRAIAQRRAADEDPEEMEDGTDTSSDGLTDERFRELEALEQFVLTVTDRGFGKRTSAFEYRVIGRGGQGVAGIDLTQRNGSAVVACFPIGGNDQVMLVTDGGQLIRIPVDDIRIARRQTQGVTLFRVDDGERVVSVTRIDDAGGDADETDGADPSADDAGPVV
ncbi:MAG: DNA gyrase subunit A [Alphaproteobacteria bacterium]|nr:DNA gyrase subunit A [Alphaproteobacteria bacterium]